MQFDDIAPKCEYIHAHPDLIHKAETLMPDEDDLYDCLLYTSRCV